ncbi:MAG: hypothetical protein HYR62_05660 [Actinobacteria bacterium]|nr:hypothetical protein [Actinomycetota bacterium]MBI3688526.1 hypothetical protein [Actinomycetota bacterium]
MTGVVDHVLGLRGAALYLVAVLAVLAGRFVAFLRATIPFLAGTSRMP